MIRNIAIVSLSSGIIGEPSVQFEVEIGLRRLEEYGLNVRFMPHARKGLEYVKAHPEKRALFAGYLSRIGDDRALPDLEAAAKEPDVSYLTFIELRNAIESLGGVCPEREYDDDPEYEAPRDL